MKPILISTVLLLTLGGCAAPQTPVAVADPQTAAATQTAAVSGLQLAQVDSIDDKVEVNYRCDTPKGEKTISVMYGVKDGTLVLAQLKVGEEFSPGLYRVLNDVNGDKQNRYYSEGLTWSTGKATPQTAGSVDGDMLTQAQTLSADGQPQGTQDVLLKSCRVY